MKTLIVNKNGSLEVSEVPIPTYTSKQALVKTVSCGICNGTDAKLIHHSFKGYDESRYPLMLGHEAVGKVIEMGSEVTSFQLGDYVMLPFTDPDPTLYGALDSAWGSFSEYGVVHDPAAYEEGTAPECAYGQTVLPKEIDPVDGAMVITLREVLSSIYRFGMKEGESIAVFGCGPVGQTFIHFMHLLGIGPIIALDIVDDKLKDALAHGADYVFNSSLVNVEESIRHICPNGVQYVLDAVGISAIINQAMGLICDTGKICCYGIAPKCQMALDWARAPYNWQLQFQQFPSKIEEGAVSEQIYTWIKEGNVDLKDYISDYFEFSDVLAAFDKLEQRQISKKGIVRY